MNDNHDVPWQEARHRAARLARRTPFETVDLADADRRILAEDVHALVDLPGFDSSAMDGWAVAGEPPWRVTGSILAGAAIPPPLDEGCAVRIATGAPLPPGTSGVVRSENSHVGADGLVTGHLVGPDMRRRAEECRAGDVLATQGTQLTPPLIGLLAAAGHDGVTVASRPRVRLVLMGDELQSSGLPEPGRVRDSLGPQLPALLDRAGAHVVDVRRLSDSLDELIDALVAPGVDVILSTGGTAAGPRDHVHEAVARAGGNLVVDGVGVRPGHPMAVADLGPDRAALVALPGNPQAAIVGVLTLALPLLAEQLGTAWDRNETVAIGEGLNAPAGQTRLVGGIVVANEFHKSEFSGSAMLRGLAASTGYAVIPPGGAAPGELVPWLRLP